ncbi:MAG TPA: NUDIX hydrolase [Syntrophales bacterium]|nr:NUDIX hydrolase [Syntrophales bacterium]HRT62653.1 NUDIX hydrolase [Syntrophales bacterium]
MKRQPKRFCSLCGGVTVTRREDNVPRSYCETCGVFFYENPLPVVSTILLSDRKILLVKRGKKPYRGMWCLPTGFAEAGESIEDAALRELEEETGMRGSIVGLVDLGSAENYYYGDLLFVTFEVEATGGRLARGGDADTVRYFPLDRIPRLAFTSNKKAIEAFIRSKADAWAILDSFNLAVTEGTAGKKKKNLLSDRLIEVIEKNADRIARLWLEDVTTNHSTAGYHHVDRDDLFNRAYGIISQFGRWLGGYYRDQDIRNFYTELGRERHQAGFKLSEVLSAQSLLKKHIWEFALSRGMWQKTLDIYMALELDRRIVVFFDKAAFYTTKGYEGKAGA